MKTTSLLLAAAVFTGLASVSFAGSGQQFWTQQSKNQQEQKARAAAPAESTTNPVTCSACSCCSSMTKT